MIRQAVCGSDIESADLYKHVNPEMVGACKLVGKTEIGHLLPGLALLLCCCLFLLHFVEQFRCVCVSTVFPERRETLANIATHQASVVVVGARITNGSPEWSGRGES